MNTSRRGFLSGIASLLAAPAIVRASSLMPVKALPTVPTLEELFWSPRLIVPSNMYPGALTWIDATLDEHMAQALRSVA